MKGNNLTTFIRSKKSEIPGWLTAHIAALVGLFFCPFMGIGNTALAQGPGGLAARVGEKITYNVSFGRFNNIAYAEIGVVSSGKLLTTDAVELKGRFKTLELISAAFYYVDESRAVFVDAATGMPLHVTVTENGSGLPREIITNYMAAPAQGFDLVSLIYKIRQSGGNGTLSLAENGRNYGVAMQTTGAEKVRTELAEYDTTVVSLQSDYFTERGLKDVRINLSNDEARIPAMIRFKTAKGEFKAVASTVQLPSPETVPLPVPVQTPFPTPMPRPAATPQPYIDNQPLAAELAFELGEILEYRVSTNGRPVGNFKLEARERKEIEGRDSLVLSATVTRAEAGNPVFALGDSFTSIVSPDTLTPRRAEISFRGALSSLNQSIRFDPSSGAITFRGANPVDAPIGTHTLLTLLYAARSFNLKPSRDMKNPVNDTRVAVVWANEPYIFTLRPSESESITINGQKISAQKISITTGTSLDQLQPAVWLGNDARRLPLRISAGGYVAELISENLPLNR